MTMLSVSVFAPVSTSEPGDLCWHEYYIIRAQPQCHTFCLLQSVIMPYLTCKQVRQQATLMATDASVMKQCTTETSIQYAVSLGSQFLQNLK